MDYRKRLKHACTHMIIIYTIVVVVMTPNFTFLALPSRWRMVPIITTFSNSQMDKMYQQLTLLVWPLWAYVYTSCILFFVNEIVFPLPIKKQMYQQVTNDEEGATLVQVSYTSRHQGQRNNKRQHAWLLARESAFQLPSSNPSKIFQKKKWVKF